MAISPDVLATALQEQLPGYSELFTLWHPLLEKMVTKGGIESAALAGPYREFVVTTDGPGQVSQINTGSEVISGGRTQAAQRGNEYGTRMIYAFDVPGKDLAEANGAQDLAKILQNYPELGLSHFHELLARQLGTGDGAGVSGWFTLNGNTTYSPNGSSRAGLVEFAAPSSQSNVVHGLSAATVTGWQNQYGHLGAVFTSGGRALMRKVFYQCQRQSANVIGPVDLAFADEASYLNYIDDLDSYIRIVDKTTEKLGDMAPDKVRQGVKFETAMLYLEEFIDITAAAYTGSPVSDAHADNGGVIYFVPSGVMKMFTLGSDTEKETKGFFDSRGPFRIPDQDMWRYEFVLHGNMHATSRRHIGAVTGTAT